MLQLKSLVNTDFRAVFINSLPFVMKDFQVFNFFLVTSGNLCIE